MQGSAYRASIQYRIQGSSYRASTKCRIQGSAYRASIQYIIQGLAYRASTRVQKTGFSAQSLHLVQNTGFKIQNSTQYRTQGSAFRPSTHCRIRLTFYLDTNTWFLECVLFSLYADTPPSTEYRVSSYGRVFVSSLYKPSIQYRIQGSQLGLQTNKDLPQQRIQSFQFAIMTLPNREYKVFSLQ